MKKYIFWVVGLALLGSCQRVSDLPPTVTVLPSASPTIHVQPSPTATNTPVPVFTPTPIPLYFTDEFTSAIDGWASFQTGGNQAPSVKFEYGTLKLDFNTPDTWYFAVQNAHQYSKVFVSTRFSGTTSGSAGLICNYSEENGWYEFNVSQDGTYAVLYGQWLAPEIARYSLISMNSSEYLKPGLFGYEIGLTCIENTLFLHINGKLFRKLDVSRYGLHDGKIGLTAASFDEVPMTLTFEWIKVAESDQ